MYLLCILWIANCPNILYWNNNPFLTDSRYHTYPVLNLSICWCFWVLHFVLLIYLFSVITRVFHLYSAFWVSDRETLSLCRNFRISSIVGSLHFLLGFFLFLLLWIEFISLNFLIGVEKVTEFCIIHLMQTLLWTFFCFLLVLLVLDSLGGSHIIFQIRADSSLLFPYVFLMKCFGCSVTNTNENIQYTF